MNLERWTTAIVVGAIIVVVGASIAAPFLTAPAPTPSPGPSAPPSAPPSPQPGCRPASPTPEASPTPVGAIGIGDRCAYVSVYVHDTDERSPIDPRATVTAVRVSVFEDPDAPSVEVRGEPIGDGGVRLPVTSGAIWRILVDGKPIYDRDAARIDPNRVCPEAIVTIAAGESRRFVFEVARTSDVVSCAGGYVAIVNANYSIEPDRPPPPPPVQLNPVRLSRDVISAIRYRPEVVAYWQSVIADREGPSTFGLIFAFIGIGGAVVFGGFAVWLLFATHSIDHRFRD